MKYPEHDKQAAVNDEAQTIGEFLDWMRNSTDRVIAEWCGRDQLCEAIGSDPVDGSEDHWIVQLIEALEKAERSRTVLMPTRESTNVILADYFEIDLSRLEEEKQEMLRSIRQQLEEEDE